MKNKLYFAFSFFVMVLGISLLPQIAAAQEMKLIFLYPGGQGSQSQAQPLLDSLAEGLKKHSQNKLEPKIYYFSDLNAGTQFIQKEKPAGGILSEDLFEEKQASWKLKPIAQTLSNVDGKSIEQYYILGHKDQTLPTGKIQVVTSRPLSAAFAQRLFPTLKNQLEFQNSENMMSKLRAVGSAQENSFILLDQFEYKNISQLKTDWATGLKVMASSEKVPTAPFVIFEGNISAEQSQSLQEALVKISQDSSMKETLSTLRLKGFEKR